MNVTWKKADLRDVDLTGAQLGKVKLSGADLRGATVNRIDFKTFNLKNVSLDTAQAIAVAQSYGAKIN